MVEVVIGGTKSARAGYSFEQVAIAPQRRTRDASEVSTAWSIDAYKFETPFIAAPMDSVVSPESAVSISRNGALAVLNLEGLWGRYEDPAISFARSPTSTPSRQQHCCSGSMQQSPLT